MGTVSACDVVLIGALGPGAEASGGQVAPGPQGHPISRGFLGSSTACSAGMGLGLVLGVSSSSPSPQVSWCQVQGWGKEDPWVPNRASSEGAGGVHSCILGLAVRWGTAAWLLLCWHLMNNPILSLH